MPGNTESLFYSFNIGPVHFIGFSTEVYYFMNYGIKTLINQYTWLEKDLQEANLAANREVRPWIVTFGHRPMYCSNENGDDCTHSQTLVRVGLPFTGFFALEPLFYKYGVDVEIWAHEHSYERLWPIYDYKVYNGSKEEPYKNPGAPVHVVTGSAGCKEGREPFINASLALKFCFFKLILAHFRIFRRGAPSTRKIMATRSSIHTTKRTLSLSKSPSIRLVK